MSQKTGGAKAPLNPMYESMSFAFTTTGNSRVIKGRPRFTRARMSEAIRTETSLKHAKNLILSNGETHFVLSTHQTALITGSDGMIEEMILNGWKIDTAPEIFVEFFNEYQITGKGE